MNFSLFFCLLLSFFLTALPSYASNKWTQSYSKAKNTLEQKVYLTSLERKTIYCQAQFFEDKSIALPQGFTTQKHVKRANKIEWEHIVPVENFGRAFTQWREGDRLCVDSKGKYYKGRKCAQKTNEDFRYMQADMYNLYPAIGAINASRSNFNFTPFIKEKSTFGSCEVKINNKKVEVPEHSRGKIARAYLYMEANYKSYTMSKQQRKLMLAWDKQYPVHKEECVRTKRIEQIQKNENLFVKNQCLQLNYWN